MPEFLEAKLKKQYPNNPHAVFGTMNKIGAMRGNKETDKGRAMEAKHFADQAGIKKAEFGDYADDQEMPTPAPKPPTVMSRFDGPPTPLPQQAEAGPPQPAPVPPMGAPSPNLRQTVGNTVSAPPATDDIGMMMDRPTPAPMPEPARRYGQGPAALALQKATANYADVAGKKVPWWQTALGLALSATGPGRAAAPFVMQPRGLGRAERQVKVLEGAAEEERKQQASEDLSRYHNTASAANEEQQKSLAEARQANAQARKENADANMARINEVKDEHARKWLLDQLGTKEQREDSQYQKQTDEMGPGYVFVPDPNPEHEGWGYARPPAVLPLPESIAEWLPGRKAGDKIPYSEFRKAMDYAQRGKLEGVKGDNRNQPRVPLLDRAVEEHIQDVHPGESLATGMAHVKPPKQGDSDKGAISVIDPTTHKLVRVLPGQAVPEGALSPSGETTKNLIGVKDTAADAKAGSAARSAYEFATRLAANPSPTNDYALLMSFIGATKPEGLAKLRLNQNEVALVEHTRGLLGDIESWGMRLHNGEKFPDEQRAQMLSTMKLVADSYNRGGGQQGGGRSTAPGAGSALPSTSAADNYIQNKLRK